MKLKNVINKHKSNKIKENSNTVRHLNNGTDHRHSKSRCDQSSPARRTTNSRKDVTHRELCLLVQFVGEIHQLVGLNRNYFIITVNIHMGKS